LKIIAVASLKGGVGKTSTALFLASALAVSGTKVVLIDADPNNNATDYLAREESAEELENRSLYAYLSGRRKMSECIIPVMFNLDLVPGTPSLARATLELSNDPGVAFRFPRAIRALDAEVAIIDTPPSLTLELTLAMYAADVVIVPVCLSRWTVSAYRLIGEKVRMAGETTGKEPGLFALASIVTEREAETLHGVSEWTMLQTSILKTTSIRNAANTGKPLNASTRAWSWYCDLAKELSL
jgi:chromosome partitioning protein